MRDRDGRRRDGRGKPRDGMNQTNGGGTECDNAVDQLTDALTLLQFQFPPMKTSFPFLLLLAGASCVVGSTWTTWTKWTDEHFDEFNELKRAARDEVTNIPRDFQFYDVNPWEIHMPDNVEDCIVENCYLTNDLM